MAQNPMQSFIALINFDQQTRELKNNVIKYLESVSQFEAQIRKLQHILEEKKQELSSVKRQLSDAELEFKSIEMIIGEKRLESEKQNNYKILSSKKTEIERLSRLQSEQERLVLDLVNRVDHLAKGFEKNSTDVQQEITEYENHIQAKKEEIKKIEKMLAQQEHNRSTLLTEIPAEWQTLYNEMREKVPDPVVPLSHESCSGCFSMLTPADLQFIRKNKLIPCKLCYRLIYLE